MLTHTHTHTHTHTDLCRPVRVKHTAAIKVQAEECSLNDSELQARGASNKETAKTASITCTMALCEKTKARR